MLRLKKLKRGVWFSFLNDFNNSRTVSMLLNSISDSELGHVIHFNNSDSSLSSSSYSKTSQQYICL